MTVKCAGLTATRGIGLLNFTRACGMRNLAKYRRDVITTTNRLFL